MAESNEWSATPCVLSECAMFGRGHKVNPIQGRLVGEQPWGWRDGTVSEVSGLEITVSYLDDGTVRLWHHHTVPSLRPGSPVRVHEGQCMAILAGRWLSVQIADGVGAVPEPEHPELWAQETHAVIVNVSTGEGFIPK